jgi:hypothetical protein
MAVMVVMLVLPVLVVALEIKAFILPTSTFFTTPLALAAVQLQCLITAASAATVATVATVAQPLTEFLGRKALSQ